MSLTSDLIGQLKCFVFGRKDLYVPGATGCLAILLLTLSLFTVVPLLSLEDPKLFSWMSPPLEWTLMPGEAYGICY